MEKFFPVIYDIIAVIIGMVIIYRAFQTGFLRSVVLAAGYLCSIVASVFLSKMITVFLYTNFIRGWVIDYLEKLFSEISASLSIEEIVSQAVLKLPDFLKGAALAFFQGEENLSSAIIENMDNMTDTIPIIIADNIAAPIINLLLQSVLCIILFIICVWIVKTIAKIFKKFYAIPVLGPINCFLGGVLGILQAGIVLYLVGVALFAIFTVGWGTELFFNDATVRQSYLFKYFYDPMLVFAS